MLVDPRKKIVADGYDRIAERYLDWQAGAEAKRHYLAELVARVPRGGRLLDLGCGPGIPVATELAKTTSVTGIDLSSRQIALAERNVPTARFIVGDMTDVDLPAAHFDAVAAFFSITHVPREQHAGLLAQIRNWLRPGGVFVGSLGARSLDDDVSPDWLGAPMFFSHFDAATNLAFVAQAGLICIHQDIVAQQEDGRSVTFLWLIAERPR